jgi:hypothetical protein
MSLKHDSGDYDFFGTRPPEEDQYPCENYHIEKITGDNRRPGMPEQDKYLVRFRPHPSFGWLGCATFRTGAEAESFALSLTAEGYPPQEEQ